MQITETTFKKSKSIKFNYRDEEYEFFNIKESGAGLFIKGTFAQDYRGYASHATRYGITVLFHVFGKAVNHFIRWKDTEVLSMEPV